MPAMILTVVAVLIGLAILAFTVWVVIDILGHPNDEFMVIGQNRAIWLVAVIGFTLACGPVSLLVSAYYLLRIRPQLLPVTPAV
jgi:hypothetical protein